MADRGDTHYHVRHLNLWFAVSSLALLAATLWMVLDDWSRPWKGYQREFKSIEVTRAEAQLASPEAQAVIAEEAQLKKQLEQAEQHLAGKKTELEQAEKTLLDLKGERFKATEA